MSLLLGILTKVTWIESWEPISCLWDFIKITSTSTPSAAAVFYSFSWPSGSPVSLHTWSCPPSLPLPRFFFLNWENRCYLPNGWGKAQYPWIKMVWEHFLSAHSFYAWQVTRVHHKPISTLGKVWEFFIWCWFCGMGDARLRDSGRLAGSWHHVVDLEMLKGSKDSVLWYSLSCSGDPWLLKMPGP